MVAHLEHVERALDFTGGASGTENDLVAALLT
jgi:hypothetical protein